MEPALFSRQLNPDISCPRARLRQIVNKDSCKSLDNIAHLFQTRQNLPPDTAGHAKALAQQ